MADPGDVVEEELQSPRSPVGSEYGGSDAGQDVGHQADTDMDAGNQTATMYDEAFDNYQNRVENGNGLRDESENEDVPREQEDNEEDEPEAETNNAAPLPDTISTTAGSQASLNPAPESDEGRRYKYKYPEAYPTPPGWDDEVWNKAYTAADSRIYNHAKKNHQVSKQKRGEGVTRTEALRWEEQRAEREAKKGKKSTGGPKQQTPRSFASSSTPTASVQTPSAHADMANKKNQKKKKAEASMSVANGSSQQPNHFTASSPDDLSFSSAQTLADRIKGKSAASAAASSALTGDSGMPSRAESEKASQPKKGGGVPIKKQPNTKGNLLPPATAKPQTPAKFATSKPRNSKSGTPASVRYVYQSEEALELFSDDEADDDNNLYCVCRGPQSINMIFCEACQEWFHRRSDCIGEGDPALYKNYADHLDLWFCPPCKKKDPSLEVTWFRLCRNPRCDKPARTNEEPPSKYCSEDCAVKFFEDILAQAPKGTEPSRGGALTQAEIGKLLEASSSAAEFKEFGKAAPKFRGNGKVVSKQFLRNMTNLNMSNAEASEGNVEKAGKVFRNKADYKEKMSDEDFDRKVAGHVERNAQSLFHQKPTGPPLNREQFVAGVEQALGGGNKCTAEDFMDVNFSWLQMHGLIDPTEAELIFELQSMMTYQQTWMKIADLKTLYIKAIIQRSAETLKAQNLALKTACGYLSKISISDMDFYKWTESDAGAKFMKWATAEDGSISYEATIFRQWATSREGIKYVQGGEHDNRAVNSQIAKWGKDIDFGAMCMHSVKKHTTHFKWAEVHDKDNTRRKLQLTDEFKAKLAHLNGVMDMVLERVVQGQWKPVRELVRLD